MKKRTSFICMILFLILSLSPAGAAVKFTSYINNNYNYKIIIPDTWKRKESFSKDNHRLYASKDTNTEISVRAFKSKDDGIEKAAHSKTWDLRQIDPGLHKIIETGKIKTQQKITGKLLIFEYRTTGNSFLHRTLITQNNGIIYIIECKSPESSFYKYDDIFTTAFASFMYLGRDIKSMSSRETPHEELNEELEEIELNEGTTEEQAAEDELI